MCDTNATHLGPLKDVDQEGMEVFANDGVKHEVLHKIWALHRADEVHHLSEVRKLDHIEFYRPVSYRCQEVSYGVNYFGKIVLDEKGHCVHVRVFRQSGDGAVKFHAIHNKPREDGGAVFSEKDEITYFEY